MQHPDHAGFRSRLTRRRMLLLVGGAAAGTGLVAVSGADAWTDSGQQPSSVAQAIAAVLGAGPETAFAQSTSSNSLGVFQQASQNGFTSINAKLTFGPPTDLASGWDGTLWAIDTAGAPHLYDPTHDQWELFGDGVDAAALIQDAGPAVYFRGAEVYIANGPQLPQPIAHVWPTLPASYQQGVHGAAWANGQLYLFRGGTYLAVPGSTALGGAEPTHEASPAATAVMTPGSSEGTPSPLVTATPTPPAGQPTSTPSPAPTQHAARQALVFGGLVRAAAQTATATPTGTAKANATATQTATAEATASASRTATSGTPTATPTPQPSATPTSTATPQPSATSTDTPTPQLSATPTDTPTPQPSATPSGTPEAGPGAVPTAAALASLPGWPQSGGWGDGVIDGAYSVGGGVVLLLRGHEFVSLNLSGSTPSVSAPAPLTQHAAFQSLPADWVADGFDAGFHVAGGSWKNWNFCFKGPRVMLTQAALGGATPASPTVVASPTEQLVAPELGLEPGVYYLSAVGTPWPANWNPVLKHAPTGRGGGLWAATTAGAIVSHDGTRWTQQPGSATSVAAGADASVFAVSQNSNQLQQWTGNGWKQVAQGGGNLSQVSAGDKDHVWVRDTGNTVHQLAQSQLQPVPLLGAAADMTANFDGTVWSCNGKDSHAF
ncbi:MAG: hypothetical protein JOZ81_20365, partial [Chloroflexi bacterium]|nr:hypothetical protein [Chloroflexota bacterium]